MRDKRTICMYVYTYVVGRRCRVAVNRVIALSLLRTECSRVARTGIGGYDPKTHTRAKLNACKHWTAVQTPPRVAIKVAVKRSHMFHPHVLVVSGNENLKKGIFRVFFSSTSSSRIFRSLDPRCNRANGRRNSFVCVGSRSTANQLRFRDSTNGVVRAEEEKSKETKSIRIESTSSNVNLLGTEWN